MIILFNYSAIISFIYGSGYIYEEKTALRYTDVFINCSVNPIDAYTSWYFEDTHILNSNKYSQNISGLMIYNITEEDQGNYICFLGDLDPLSATIRVNIVCKLPNTTLIFFMYSSYVVGTFVITTLGSPELFWPQNRTVEVNVSEEVALNCSASSLPDPVYTWSIPDSCSSCPKFSNDSVMSFTADISSNGDYICMAENDYGNVTKHITISVLCKLIIVSCLQVHS